MLLIKKRQLPEQIAAWWHKCLDEKGSFTLEASLVFPIILIVTMALVFFAVYIYMNIYCYGMASLAADRAAFTWNNSHRDPVTGSIDMNGINQTGINNDGLYWRTLRDGVFGLPGSLPDYKINRAIATVHYNASAYAKYENRLLSRTVRVGMYKNVPTPELFPHMYGPNGRAQADTNTMVTDPVEFMRSFDLLYYYLPTVKTQLEDGSGMKDLMSKVTAESKRR
ncbi:MAG: TadE/TadG family type IV pilus assembly protein [Syntrophomonadaceae bacterium]|jgi:hypothetical protein